MRTPEGWATATIGEVTEPVTKRRPDESPDQVFTYIDISSIKGTAIESPKRLFGHEAPSRARQVTRGGDVLLSTVRTNLKHTALVPNDLDNAVASTGFSVLRPSSEIAPKFLFFRVLEQAFVDALSAKQTGSSYPAVRDSDVRAMRIAFPAFPEQERIVSTIEEQFSRLDGAGGSLDHAAARIRSLRRAVLQGAIPPSSPSIELGALLDRVEAGKSFRVLTRPAQDDEWGIIKVSAMTWGEFREGENKALPPERTPDGRFEIRPGDLLLSRANTREHVGASVLVGACRPRLLLSDKSLRLVTTKDVDVPWLWRALSAPSVRAQISALATGTKDGMRNISQGNLKSLPLPGLSLTDQSGRSPFEGPSVMRVPVRVAAARSRPHGTLAG